MVKTFKIRISDRKVSEYSVVDAYSLKTVAMPKGLNPIQSKLMNQDIFTCEDEMVLLLHYLKIHILQIVYKFVIIIH